MNWYLKKEFYDSVDGIESVTIHYTWTPRGSAPDWSVHRESRLMPAGEYLKTGVGEVAKYGPPAPSVPQYVHPRLRKKILKLPNEIYDEPTGAWTGNYLLHYYYEIVRDGQTHYSPVYTDEIATREVVVVDPLGILGGVCTNWSVYDWDAPQFTPTEDPQFTAAFGEDHPLRQFKFYGVTDREDFMVVKKALLDTLPLPRRFTARISAPVGATVRVRFHVANWGLPEEQRWEDYWLDESFVMTPDAETLVFTPLGTEAAAAPLVPVAPELLAGNVYASLVPGDQSATVEATAALREAESIIATTAGASADELVAAR